MAHRRTVLAALSAPLLIGGCGILQERKPPTPSGRQSYEQRQQQAKEFVAARGRAVIAGDEAAWLAGIDPGQAETIAREQMRFRNLRQLHAVTFDLVLNGIDDLGGPAAALRPELSTLLRGRVHAVAQYEADVAHNRQDYDYTFRRVDGELSIVDVTPVDPTTTTYGRPTHNAPWDSVPLKSARTATVTILAAADSPWDPRDFVDVARRADALVRGVWGGRPAPRGFLVFLATSAQKREWFSAGKDLILANAVGFAYNPEIVDAAGSPETIIQRPGEPPTKSMAGSRLVIDMTELKTPEQAYRVIAHEMAHGIAPHLMPRGEFLETSSSAILNQPHWAIEGFAEWVEILAARNLSARRDFIRRNWARYRPAGDLPANDGFYSQNSARTTFNYQVSAMFFVAAERIGGRRKAVELYEHFVGQPTFVADTRMFLDGPLRNLGVAPDRFWSVFRSLTR